ncbi:MAG: MGH1-like glycoside hydrolase domain-containing protein [Bryobacteraceae bacterium]
MTHEEIRLRESRERRVHWKRWGPYLSERAWGTVREDYSPNGAAWEYFPHDHARSKAYRWGEDGLGGICDRRQFLCFALALWNGRDPILKERLFGLTGKEGNHGEDVNEYYLYLDSTPTHSYMKYLYKYPHAAYPYAWLVEENRRRGRQDFEFELLDTGVFAEDRYFDVFAEYAKDGPENYCIKISVANRGPESATLDLLPTIWFRNTWSWTFGSPKPSLRRVTGSGGAALVDGEHFYLNRRRLYCEGSPELLFTENETNAQRLYGATNPSPYVKDGINDYIVHGARQAVNPAQTGTKASAHYRLTAGPGETKVVRLKLVDGEMDRHRDRSVFDDFDDIFAARLAEADEFYQPLAPPDVSGDARRVQRQAFAGMLWSKQFYHYDVETWLHGDPALPAPPPDRLRGRNAEWRHLYNADVISMPDKWEYPWYAAWDLGFHCIALALVDAEFAKEQLVLMLREWYMHPNGQIPAYEWAFSDVNPPVHAWAAWRVYKIDKKRQGKPDRLFLERIFHKLLLNFTWWVNRKDAEGNNLFQGGFLGLDNIGVFDRSKPLPTGGNLEQSDGTSWMAMYTLNMLAIALELSTFDAAYEDVASKFFEHFVHITEAMNHIGQDGFGLWDEPDGFYYDVLHFPDGSHEPMKIRSMVGLIPLLAVETLDPEVVNRLPGFRRRMEWFLKNRENVQQHIDEQPAPNNTVRRLLAVANLKRLPRVLRYMLDENEFLSPHGIRALSRYHKDHAFCLWVNGQGHCVDYEPAESTSGLFGGNSNWRGPIWFPVNFLLLEALQKFHHFTGDDYKVEFPTASGNWITLWDVAAEISRRLSHIFLRDEQGRRPVYGGSGKFQTDPQWRDLICFYEYFHGDNGAGLGASHQTGWTGLVAKLIQQSGE